MTEDSDFKTKPVIVIGSSSRCTRSSTRANEENERTQDTKSHEVEVIISETKTKSINAGSSVNGSPVDNQPKSETPDEVEKKRKPIISESSNSDRRRPQVRKSENPNIATNFT
ncbi:hypothetical protein L6452_40605 [Arctium lappa]|uniref:Uncharacterized protein n=1 Tax=Arctium lappa TaxID=4217 RepID=A0ACB8XMD7_ARCLA|nr:hypothetical protein L6452_40605 [Arctium lappa]